MKIICENVFKDCYGVEYFFLLFVMLFYGIFREIIDILIRIVINIKKMMNVWCLCGLLLFLLFIDKKLFILILFICWRLWKVLYIFNCVRLCLFFFCKFWILVIVVEMYWDFFKEGCCKKCRIFDIIFLSCLFDILK